MINMISPSVAKVGDNVLSTEQGQFFTYGTVVLMKKKECIVVLTDGKKERIPSDFPAAGLVVGKLTLVLDQKEAEALAPAKTNAAPKGKPTDGGKTKIQLCRELMASNRTLGKEEMKALFVSQANCTPAGSNTYFLTLSKEVVTS